jgi:hypothetical protein
VGRETTIGIDDVGEDAAICRLFLRDLTRLRRVQSLRFQLGCPTPGLYNGRFPLVSKFLFHDLLPHWFLFSGSRSLV